MTFTESVGSRSDPSSSPRPPQRRDGVRGDGPQPTGTSPAQVIFAVVYVAVFPLGLADAWIPGGHRIPFLLSAYAVLFLAGCFVFRHYLARAARRIAARKCRTALVVLVGGIGAYVATVAGFLLSGALLRATGLSGVPLQNNLNIGRAMETIPPIIIIAVLGVMGPVVEEMFFRRFLIDLIGHYSRTWVAVAASGILFGMIHMHSPALSEAINIIPHAATGIVLGVVYVKSGRNLYCSAVLHILINLGSLLPSLAS